MGEAQIMTQAIVQVSIIAAKAAVQAIVAGTLTGASDEFINAAYGRP